MTKQRIPLDKVQPAYLSWRRDSSRRGYEVVTLHDEEGFAYLRQWQADRCAMCGYCDKLVLDHCHETGLARGFLCHECNVLEGKSSLIEWRLYRLFPPTKMLDLKFYYDDFGKGWGVQGSSLGRANMDKDIELWSSEFCYTVMTGFEWGHYSLDWAEHHEICLMFSKFINHVKRVVENVEV